MSEQVDLNECRCLCHSEPFINHVVNCCARCGFCGGHFKQLEEHLEGTCAVALEKFKEMCYGEDGNGG